MKHLIFVSICLLSVLGGTTKIIASVGNGNGRDAALSMVKKPSRAAQLDKRQVLKEAKPAFKDFKQGRGAKRRAVNFVEVEIVLNDEFSLSDIRALPRAPGSDVVVVGSGKRVRVQLSANELKALAGEGAKVTVRKKFVLVDGYAGKKGAGLKSDAGALDVGIDADCYGSNDANYPIPEGDWTYSDIPISCAPGGATVTSIDVHYEIIHTYIGDLVVDLSNQAVSIEYRLWEFEGGSADNINETETGITTFNGEVVNQIWTLWGADAASGDDGYIDYWWIKVYYTEGGGSPANDDCVDAITVTEGVAYIGSTVGATGVDESSCGGGDTADVWHSFTPTSTGTFFISLCGSGFDTTLAVYDGCLGTELACNDNSCGLQSEVTIDLMAGITYIVRVAGYGGATGSYTLLAGKPLLNDDCVDAIAVTEGAPYLGSTVGATGVDESSCSEGDTADVWHSYTATCTGTVMISLVGSAFDTTLSVFDECGGMELACNDDISYPSVLQSELSLRVTTDTTYIIRVAGYNGATGGYTLNVTCTPCTLPPEPNNPSPASGANDVPLDTVLSWNGGDAAAAKVRGGKAAGESGDSVVTPKVIYGNDDRLEEYEVTDPNILAAGDSTVAILLKSDLVNNGDGTFSLPTETYTEWYLGEYSRPLCLDEPFYDQPVPAFCSGFLVAPDIVVTAGHCAEAYSCGNFAFVFGFVMLDASTPVLTIDASEIYYCSEIIDYIVTSNSDWGLVRLDREVTGHSPLAVRTEGVVTNGEPLLVIGHPVGLPRKYAGGATVRDNTPPAYFQTNVDTYIGNSGSAVFNANTLEVEGIMVRGHEDWVEDGSCDRSRVCPDSGCPGWEDVTRTTEFADLISDKYDVYFDVVVPPSRLMCSDVDVTSCDPCDPCGPEGALRPGIKYYWQVVAKNWCGETPGPNEPDDCWHFTTAIQDINVALDTADLFWIYQNLPDQNGSSLTADALINDDPMGNSSYSYKWEFTLPTDVTLEPNIIGPNDTNSLTFAARGCDEPNGFSDSGQPFTVKVTVTGNEYDNSGTAEVEFGIALLGDVNNDTIVDIADRSIVNAFWRSVVVPFTLRDCDVNCDGIMDVADRAITNAIMRGTLCQNSTDEPCPFR